MNPGRGLDRILNPIAADPIYFRVLGKEDLNRLMPLILYAAKGLKWFRSDGRNHSGKLWLNRIDIIATVSEF